MRNLAAYENKKYFSLFFIPLIPGDRKDQFLMCETCGATYYMSPEEQRIANASIGKNLHGQTSVSEIEKEEITCSNCGQRLRVPKDKQRFTNITCTSCGQDPFIDPSRGISDFWSRRKTTIKMYALVIGICAVAVFLMIHYFKPQNDFVDEVIATQQPAHDDEYHGYTPISTVNTAPQTQGVSSVKTPVINEMTTGDILSKNSAYLTGDGELNIQNGTSRDAVAKLVLNNRSVFTVYIKAGNNYRVKNISDGTYKLVFALGNIWDSANNVFINNQSYSVFEDFLNFETTETQSTGYTITLNPVINGTAQTKDVDKTEFNSY